MDCNNWLCAGYYICFFCFKMFYVDFCYMILNTTKLFLRDYYPVGCGYKVIVYVDAYFRQEWDIIIRVFVQRFHGYFVKEFRVFGNVRMSLRVNSTFFSHTLVHGGSFFFYVFRLDPLWSLRTPKFLCCHLHMQHHLSSYSCFEQIIILPLLLCLFGYQYIWHKMWHTHVFLGLLFFVFSVVKS